MARLLEKFLPICTLERSHALTPHFPSQLWNALTLLPLTFPSTHALTSPPRIFLKLDSDSLEVEAITRIAYGDITAKTGSRNLVGSPGQNPAVSLTLLPSKLKFTTESSLQRNQNSGITQKQHNKPYKNSTT